MKTNKQPKNKNSSKFLTFEEQQKLLAYYQSRNDILIKDRINWLKNTEAIRISLEEFHEKEMELRKLNEEISEAQQALSEANITLAKERAKILKFTDEIDNYKCKLKIFFNYN